VRSDVNTNDDDSELSRRLFNNPPPKNAPADATITYDAALLEQYKLYVEMADRISARRGLTNSFFLTINTGIVGLIAALHGFPTGPTAWWVTIPLVVILGQCYAWFYIVRSYRQLNGAKYRVVGALEEQLPASPFWRAEWWALGEGKNRALYWPLSHIEQWVPVLFAFTYLVGYLAILLV
jgi:hypothetical protein